PESELYRLYQQLKDDAFCTAFEERNSVAATVLIKSDQERIAPCESAVNKNETPVIIGTNQVVTTPNVEEDKPKSSGNVDGEPVLPVPTKETDVGSTTTSSGGNKPHDFREAQFSRPDTQETKYKESKENFHISLRNDVVGVVITGLFIAAAVMVPSVAGAVICGIVAALALVATVIHVKDSTLPSYKEMEKNRVECIAKAAQLMI
ncbi:MAG: ankyrin repeat domain-containing protein, partial [Wolbachia endosymbiont of Melophagus ovinus]|nr:ankyrin repeat domain-containing protein [Wolbachia endosymbiont of Melophagus ovinus]